LCYGGGELLIGWWCELNEKVFIISESRLLMTLQKFLIAILSCIFHHYYANHHRYHCQQKGWWALVPQSQLAKDLDLDMGILTQVHEWMMTKLYPDSHSAALADARPFLLELGKDEKPSSIVGPHCHCFPMLNKNPSPVMLLL
jgi:hypothetical protein